jgi:hypothetical protein
MPMAKGKEPTPGTLNKGRIMGSNSIPKDLIRPVPLNNSAAIKKGSRDGNTILSQRLKPYCPAFKELWGKMISDKMKNRNSEGKNKVLNFFFAKIKLIFISEPLR